MEEKRFEVTVEKTIQIKYEVYAETKEDAKRAVDWNYGTVLSEETIDSEVQQVIESPK